MVAVVVVLHPQLLLNENMIKIKDMEIPIILLILLPFVCHGQIAGTVGYVSDGDTFHLITVDGEKIKVRVADIDCPERSQPFGFEAKEFVIDEIRDRKVTIEVKGTDRYGRTVAFVIYNGKNLSEQLLINGLAWHYRKYSDLESYAELEAGARAEKIGLWADNKPIPPWEYRKSKKSH